MRTWLKCTILAISLNYMVPAARATPVEECLAGDAYRNPTDTIWACDRALAAAMPDEASHLKALLNRAEAHYWSDNLKAAMGDVSVVLQKDETNATALFRIGWILNRIGYAEQSYAVFEELYKSDAKNGRARFGMAYLLAEAGQYEQAIIWAKEALELSPDYHLARFGLARYYWKTNNRAEALAEITGLLDLGEDVVNTGQIVTAFELPTKDLYARARLLRGQWRSEAHDIDGAKEDGEWLLERHPDAIGPYMLLVTTASNWRLDSDETLELIEKAVSLCAAITLEAPCDEVYTEQYRVLYNLKKYEEAEQLTDAASTWGWSEYAKTTKDLVAARVARKLGKTDKAKQLFLKVFATDDVVRQRALKAFKRAGYYAGPVDGPLNKNARIALDACLLDEDCYK